MVASLHNLKRAVAALALAGAAMTGVAASAQDAPVPPSPDLLPRTPEGLPGQTPETWSSPAPDPGALPDDQTQAEGPESTESLLARLHDADPAEAKTIDRSLRMAWSRSGSPTMDLLLKRGQDALQAGEVELAIGHLSALTDHAPDFAEGWHARAQAFFREEEFGLALHDLERTLALNPDHYAAMYGLAVVLEQLDRVENAHALYQRILEMYPAHAEAKEGADRLDTRVNGIEI